MSGIELKGKRAVKVNAEKMFWSNTDKEAKYDIDGDEKWVPHSQCEFTVDKNNPGLGGMNGTLVITEWFYNKLFPNG